MRSVSDTQKNIFKKIIGRMIMTTKEIGDFGEKAAEDYLVEMDYLILERNYRLKFGEIDIIAARDGGLRFCGRKDEKE